jgi:hypothetical protein
MPYTLLALLSKNSKGRNKEENGFKLKKDLLLAFKEQDVTALSHVTGI